MINVHALGVHPPRGAREQGYAQVISAAETTGS